MRHVVRRFVTSLASFEYTAARCVAFTSSNNSAAGKLGADASVLRWPPSPADLEHADEALQDLLRHEQQQGPQPNNSDGQRSRQRRRWQPAAQQNAGHVQTYGQEASRVITPTQAARLLTDAHATDVVIIDVSKACNWAESLVIATCASRGQASAAAGAILHHIQQTETEVAFDPKPTVEGVRGQDDWLLVDCGPLIVHLFTEAGRTTYDLEGLWATSENTEHFHSDRQATTLENMRV